MVICQLKNVTRTFGAHTIFTGLSLEVKHGDRIGLVGRNGEGKTTLLHILAGASEPSAGTIGWRKGLTKGLLEQIPEKSENCTTREVLLEVFEELRAMAQKMTELERTLSTDLSPAKMERVLSEYGRLQEQFGEEGGYEMEANIRRVADGLQIDALLEKRWCSLSGGERTKVGLGRLLLQRPELLLLDEPTNHLDLPALEWLTEWMGQHAGSIVVISHDRAFLDEAVNRIVEIEGGELHEYHTNYSGYVQEREERLFQEFQQYQDQQKKIKKMRDTIKRLKEWANRANPPNDGLHRRAKSMEKALARIEQLKKPLLQRKNVELAFAHLGRSGLDVLALAGVWKSFEERDVLRGVDLTLRYQERVAIVGANGTGKSTIFDLILEKVMPDEGEVRLGSNVSIGYLSQHGTELQDDLTVLEAFRESAALTEGEARGQLARFLFFGHAVFRNVSSLSGGERMRLRLAQLISEKHNVLLLDEPTNHLDIDSKEVLEEALSEFNGTILSISHDRYFLNKLFEVTYWLEGGELERYEGTYAYARSKRKNG
ncbi:ribosomal protection-like ABC-F family protein [Shouchella shacheensis]|uniref:ribosomal protection-like ABC-F family protein n=1 Tax=Shouchella shacheensis TaxID=1649580 RepID=UPI00073FAAED|nr:ABC-F family ATP-binding cassette domain-containing protein [Shouchella shacheensis]